MDSMNNKKFSLVVNENMKVANIAKKYFYNDI